MLNISNLLIKFKIVIFTFLIFNSFTLSQPTYNRLYLTESNFYFSYYFTNTNEIEFRLDGHYEGWIALGIQDLNGNEDITQFYYDGASCQSRDLYRQGGSNNFIVDTDQTYIARTITYCHGQNQFAPNNYDVWNLSYRKNTIIDTIQDILVSQNSSYKITLYKGYQDGSLTNLNSDLLTIDKKSKFQDTYTIQFNSVIETCVLECYSKTQTCTSGTDYQQFTFTLGGTNPFQYSLINYCFTNNPVIWNKLSDQEQYADNIVDLYYGIVYKLNSELFDAYFHKITFGPQTNKNYSTNQDGFIYFNIIGGQSEPASQGFIGINIIQDVQLQDNITNSNTNISDFLAINVSNGVLVTTDGYLSGYSNNYVHFFNDNTDNVTQQGQLMFIEGSKDDETNFYNVTMMRPLTAFDSGKDIVIDTTTIYQVSLYYGGQDLITDNTDLNPVTLKRYWSDVIFQNIQICGYQCNDSASSEFCSVTVGVKSFYQCKTELCNGPDPENCLKCHIDCVQCINSHSSSCTCPIGSPPSCQQCRDPDNKIFYDPSGTNVGPCVTKRPVFWNILIQDNAQQTSFYYGLDASLQYLYFKFIGGDSTQDVKITIKQISTSLSTVFQITTAKVVAWTLNNGYVLIQDNNSGSIWNIQFFKSLQNSPDFKIDFNVQDYEIQLEYNTIILNQSNLEFKYSQVCSLNCLSCVGPEEQDCITCNNISLELKDTIPGQCLLTSSLTSCTNPLEIRYFNTCILKYPKFWNKIEIIGTEFELYYGFDMEFDPNNNLPPEYMYFRLLGYNKGWIALGFGKNHDDVDMVIIRKDEGKILVEDRFSYTNTTPEKPETDKILNYKLIDGIQSDRGIWDVTFVRQISINNQDTLEDYPISSKIYLNSSNPGQQIPVTLALGDSDYFVKHTTYKRNFILFKGIQICHETCTNCIGPEIYHCISCDNILYGLKNNTPPNQCSLLNYDCHVLCDTCFGPSYTQCLKCVKPSQIAIDGNCISSIPKFWNKIQITTTLDLLYGYSSNLDQIFFRFKGFIAGMEGWLGLGFGNNMNKVDMVILRMVDNIVLIEDRYSENTSNPPSLDQTLNSQSNYYYISGGRVGENWDIQFMTKVLNVDEYDIYIDLTKRDITVAWGNDDNLTQHAGFKQIIDTRFRTYQLCQNLCLNCVGPEDNECIKCIVGYELQDKSGSPSICVQKTIQCHSDCQTDMCTSTSKFACTACSDALKFLLFGECVLKQPVLWNKIKVNSNLSVYYGFDIDDDKIYFRFVGTNQNGWIGMGYNFQMRNSDMLIIRKDTSNANQIIVEDRYALGHALPLLDKRENYQIIESSWIDGKLDITFARYKNTKDTVRDIVINHEERTLIFAFGLTHSFASDDDKHNSYLIMKSQYFSKDLVCPINCLKCTGSEDSDCSEWEESQNKSKNSNILHFNFYFLIFCQIIVFLVYQ